MYIRLLEIYHVLIFILKGVARFFFGNILEYIQFKVRENEN